MPILTSINPPTWITTCWSLTFIACTDDLYGDLRAATLIRNLSGRQRVMSTRSKQIPVGTMIHAQYCLLSNLVSDPCIKIVHQDPYNVIYILVRPIVLYVLSPIAAHSWVLLWSIKQTTSLAKVVSVIEAIAPESKNMVTLSLLILLIAFAS